MLYFTRELWLSAQKAGQLEQYEQNWGQLNEKYQAQLKALMPRLNPDAHTFFLEADVHDGELLDLVVEDGSRPAPLSEPVRPWKTTMRYPQYRRVSPCWMATTGSSGNFPTHLCGD
jgi:hypothetical protein